MGLLEMKRFLLKGILTLLVIVLFTLPASAQVIWKYSGRPTRHNLYSVFIRNVGDTWAVGDDGTILHYTAGDGWNTVASPTTHNLYSVFTFEDINGEGWAVGNNGIILHHTGRPQDIGTWSTVTSPTTNTLYSVSMLSTTSGSAVGEGGTIAHYTGGTWRTVTGPTTHTLYSVSILSTVRVYSGSAVGDVGTILLY